MQIDKKKRYFYQTCVFYRILSEGQQSDKDKKEDDEVAKTTSEEVAETGKVLCC